MSSNEGLIRYDGYSFKVFTNTAGFSNSSQKIIEDRNKNIWLVLLDGTLAKFNPFNSSFTNINIQFPALHSSEKPGGIEFIYFDKENILWLGITRTGLVKVDKQSGKAEIFDVVPPSDSYFAPEVKKFYNRVLDIYEDEHGLFWMATPDGLYTFNKVTHEMHQRNHRPAKASDWRDDNFRNIKRVQNKLWLASFGGGLYSYDLQTKKEEIFKINPANPKSIIANNINYLLPVSDSEIYLGTSDVGFAMFNTQRKKFTAYNETHQIKDLPVENLSKLIRDKDDNFWALYENGIIKIEKPEYKFHFNKFTLLNKKTQNRFSLLDLYEDEDILIIGTFSGDGLYITDKHTGKQILYPIAILENQNISVEAIFQISKDREDHIWVLTGDYIYQYNKRTKKLILTSQPPLYQNANSNSFHCFTIDKFNNVWFGTTPNGVFRYNTSQNSFTHFFAEADSAHFIPTNFISAIVTDKKERVWLISNRGFVSFYDPDKDKIQQANSINQILPGLNERKIFDAYVDSKGFLWLSTTSELIKIDCNHDQPVFVESLTTKNGLNSDNIVGLCEDDKGLIWGVEDNTFSVCSIDEKKKAIINYGLRDGLNQSGGFTRIVKRMNGKMWLLAKGGYYEFDPFNSSTQKRKDNLVVSIMAVNSIDRYFENDLKEKGQLNLQSDENSFYFEFAAIDFKRPELYHYAYKLEGFDKDWIYCLSRRSVSYTNIPGGHYTFKVKATDHKGNWESNEVRIPFFIQTPFYKKWWFISLLLLISIYGLYSFYLNRLKRHRQILGLETKAQALEKEKTQVMYENLKQHLNPHFLFNSLTSLSSLIRVDQKMAVEFLDNMSKIYRYILQSKDNELVHVKDEIKFVATFIRLQKMRFNEGLQVNIDVPEQYDHRKIAPVTLQNLIENAIKHNVLDEETPLRIDIYAENDILIVKNNLQRKKFVETSNKQGLDNLRSLYKYLSDKPVIIEEKDQCFIVKIPLI